MTVKIAITDLEMALKYLKTNSVAFSVHIRADDIALIISTVDSSGQALELQLYDMDKSQSKAKVVLTERLESLLANIGKK